MMLASLSITARLAMFLAAVNSQDKMDWQKNLTPFFIALDEECKAIQQAFMQFAEYRHLLPHAERAADEKLEEVAKHLFLFLAHFVASTHPDHKRTGWVGKRVTKHGPPAGGERRVGASAAFGLERELV